MTREDAYKGGQKLQTYNVADILGPFSTIDHVSDGFISFAAALARVVAVFSSHSGGNQEYMFVVSGHLYRPLPSSQPCGLRVKIKDGFGTRPDVFRCQVKHPRVPLTPKPRRVRHMAWFREP